MILPSTFGAIVLFGKFLIVVSKAAISRGAAARTP
jgi:hypothetical protein